MKRRLSLWEKAVRSWEKYLKITKNACLTSFALYSEERGRRGRGRMVVGFTTTYVISAYHH
jgi:hypothetical protein